MSQNEIIPLLMPKWGLAMTEGTVIDWLVETGDAVAPEAELLDIETTKIAGALEAPRAGVLRRRIAQAGDLLPVGALLGILVDGDASDQDIDTFVAAFQDSYVPPEIAEGEATTNEHIVAVDGLRLAYVREGEGEDGDSLPCILIHGFGGDANNWLFNLQALAAERAVYALDLPGHGKSAKTVGDGTVDTFATTVLGFLDALDITRAHIVGHSFGGAVGLAVMAAYPQRVASATGLAPAGIGETVNQDFIAGFVESERRKDLKAALQLLFSDPNLVSREMIADVQKYKRLEGALAALRIIAAANFPNGRQRLSLLPALAHPPAPVMVIWGADDHILDPAQADNLPASVTRHALPGVGHMAHMEAATRVNELLRTHFRTAEEA